MMSDRIDRIAARVQANEIPMWVEQDFVKRVITAGTPLKKRSARVSGVPSWALVAKGVLYKDKFGRISYSWVVSPVLDGRRWSLESRLSFAPATSGSIAQKKFEEFQKWVPLDGEVEGVGFGIVVRVFRAYPAAHLPMEEAQVALSRIGRFIQAHRKNLQVARKFWKDVMNEIGRYRQ